MQFFFFSKFLFHKPFITFQTQTSLSCISSSRTNNCRTRLLSSFFFSKNSSILYNFSLLTTYILLLYIPKCFAYHFYISQFLILESFNKTKKQVIEMLHQHFLTGKLKNIYYNLKKHTFFFLIAEFFFSGTTGILTKPKHLQTSSWFYKNTKVGNQFMDYCQIIHSMLKPFFLYIVNPRLKIEAKLTVFVSQGHDKCQPQTFSEACFCFLRV